MTTLSRRLLNNGSSKILLIIILVHFCLRTKNDKKRMKGSELVGKRGLHTRGRSCDNRSVSLRLQNLEYRTAESSLQIDRSRTIRVDIRPVEKKRDEFSVPRRSEHRVAPLFTHFALSKIRRLDDLGDFRFRKIPIARGSRARNGGRHRLKPTGDSRIVPDAPIRSTSFYDYLADPIIFYLLLSFAHGSRATEGVSHPERKRERGYSDHFGVRGRGIVCEARPIIIGPFLLYSGNTGETKRSRGKCRGIKDFTVREYAYPPAVYARLNSPASHAATLVSRYRAALPNYFSRKIIIRFAHGYLETARNKARQRELYGNRVASASSLCERGLLTAGSKANLLKIDQRLAISLVAIK